jgi:hypothetical protein
LLTPYAEHRHVVERFVGAYASLICGYSGKTAVNHDDPNVHGMPSPIVFVATELLQASRAWPRAPCSAAARARPTQVMLTHTPPPDPQELTRRGIRKDLGVWLAEDALVRVDLFHGLRFVFWSQESHQALASSELVEHACDLARLQPAATRVQRRFEDEVRSALESFPELAKMAARGSIIDNELIVTISSGLIGATAFLQQGVTGRLMRAAEVGSADAVLAGATRRREGRGLAVRAPDAGEGRDACPADEGGEACEEPPLRDGDWAEVELNGRGEGWESGVIIYWAWDCPGGTGLALLTASGRRVQVLPEMRMRRVTRPPRRTS